MLNKKEKEEMLADGRSPKRRKEFAQLKEEASRTSYSLDEFLRFLKDFQKIFSSFLPSGKRIITKYNKL